MEVVIGNFSIMELACHIRHPNQLAHLAEMPKQLKQFYPPDDTGALPSSIRSLSTACTRIYVGDEFCVARLPSLSQLKQFGETALKAEHELTLLTPVMTDMQIEHAAALFNYLDEKLPGTEVVFNDWGVMAYVAATFSSLKLSAGRILNRGFKDPRLKTPTGPADRIDTHLTALLNGSTFDGPWIRDQLSALHIGRCEQDLFPYRTHPVTGGDGLETSIYFPFGYVTSGRICWMATFGQPADNHFTPPDHCSRPCAGTLLELNSPQFVFRIFQSGNTIFYLYPPDRLDSLLATANTQGLRLVYQGFGLASS